MGPRPDFEAFAKGYATGQAQLVWQPLIADLDTPVSAMLKLCHGQPYSFLFESVQGGDVRGRYSFLGTKPDLIWRCQDGRVSINRRARTDPDAFIEDDTPPLESLRRVSREGRVTVPEGLPPMASGLFGYLSYDMVRYMERLPDANPDTLGVPEALMIRPTIMAIFDTIEDVVTLVTPVFPEPDLPAASAYRLARERLADMVAAFRAPAPQLPDPHPRSWNFDPAPTSNMTRGAYLEAVEKAKAYIRAGDVFQVVPSHRFAVPFGLPALSLYRSLRRLNPSPFMFHLDFAEFQIVGSSPEILVRLRDEEVTIRPLAGTRPRGRTTAEDTENAQELLADPKELAEHLMLLDLGRNDVGRVARIGTVKVTEEFGVEHYSHVMHIVSNVIGRIEEDKDAIDALVSGFPAGTVSGAPKVRAMEIIDELEVARRGIYAGAVGYLGATGDMDTCIALRTGLVKDGTLYVQAGCGVVADSDPEAEYEETRAKSRALIRAAANAVELARDRAGIPPPGGQD